MKILQSNLTLFKIKKRSWWLSKGKNYTILKTNILVDRFFTQPDCIKWLRAMSASVVDLCLSSPSWHIWVKLLEIDMNFNCSPIIFSKSLLVVLSNMMGQNDLVELYNVLLGLGIITVVDTLKWDGQWPKSIHMLVILINLIVHSLFLTIFLRCL